MKTKTLLISVALSISILFTSCFGSFKLTTGLYDWNMGIGSDPGKEIVFLAFIILPVYGFCLFIDTIILNTIEYWTGGNPMSMNEGEEDMQIIEHEGVTYTVTARRHEFQITDEKNETIVLKYKESVNSWFVEKNGQLVKYPDNGLTAMFNKEK